MALTPDRQLQLVRMGTVEKKPVSDVLLDSGAQASIVSRECLPSGHVTRGTIRIKPLASPVLSCPATTIDVIIGPHQFRVKAAVLDKEQLGHDLLLGENIPGRTLQSLMETMDVPMGGSKQTIPHPAGTPRREAQRTTQSATRSDGEPQQQEMGTPSGTGKQTIPQTAVAPKEEGPRSQPELTHSSPMQGTQMETGDSEKSLHLVNVVTRAQARTAAQEIEKADRDFGNDISSWEDIPTEDDFPPLPLEDDEMRGLQPANVGRKEFLTQQHTDKTLKGLWIQAKDNPEKLYAVLDGTLVKTHVDRLGQRRDLLVIPQPHRRRCFEEAHSHTLSGHFGSRKTREKMVRHYTWPGMDKDVQTWARTCSVCQKGNKSRQVRSPLVPLPVISTPWERITLDVVGPLPRSRKGYRYILTIIDHASRYPEAIPLKRIDARSTCEALIPVLARFILGDRRL